MRISTGEILLFLWSKVYEYGIVTYAPRTKNDSWYIGIGLSLSISSVTKEAEANRLKLTPEFLELKFIEAIADNTKIFFGDKVFLSFLCLPWLF